LVVNIRLPAFKETVSVSVSVSVYFTSTPVLMRHECLPELEKYNICMIFGEQLEGAAHTIFYSNKNMIFGHLAN